MFNFVKNGKGEGNLSHLTKCNGTEAISLHSDFYKIAENRIKSIDLCLGSKKRDFYDIS